MFLAGAVQRDTYRPGRYEKSRKLYLSGAEGHARHAIPGLIGNGPDITCVIGVRPLCIGSESDLHEIPLWLIGRRTIPALPRLSIAQKAGRSPTTTGQSYRDSNVPSVKQIQLQPLIMSP